MVVRIHNVSKWSVLKAGEILQLNGSQPRKVRLEINCPAPARLDVVEGDKITFLTVIEGYGVVEFYASAEAHVVATSEDDVWFFTNDGDNYASERPEAVSFTKIANRRARNPELELMMFKMNQNIERRMAAQAAEVADMRAKLAAQEGADPETGEVSDDGDEVVEGADSGDTGGAGSAPEGGSEPEQLSGQGGDKQPAAAARVGKKTA